MNKTLTLFAAVLLLGASATADDFPEVRNNEKDTEGKPMSPNEAAASLQVPDGFNVGVFAAEPDVQNPIGMNWDARGRLWVAENYTYSSRDEKFNLGFRDRVIAFEDTNRDGKADKRTVFTDQVQMLTSVEVGHGGVWLMCPPQVLFIPDANHDAVPDGPAEVVLDGFKVATQNYHNFANGLKFGPDGWLYGRCGGSCPGRIGLPGTPAEDRLKLEGGIWRYHPVRKTVEVLTHGTTNPWGHDWDEMGEMFFINTVNGHLWHLIPGAHLMRPFDLDPNTKTYELLDMHADHWHFDTGQGWGKSKYGAANEYGGGHAHTGMMIYLGDNWPKKFRGNLFTINIHGQRTNQELLSRHGSGYIAKHGTDVFHAKDPFFRANDLSYGRDGEVYMIDWSDTGECHEHTGVHRTSGRIFKITYGDAESNAPQDLYAASSAELVRLHHSKNAWHARQSRIVLSERAADGKDVTSAVQKLGQLVNSNDPVVVCRALRTLHAMDAAPRDLLVSQLEHASEHVRVCAIRLLTDHWPLDDSMGPTAIAKAKRATILPEVELLLGRLCIAALEDTSGLVRLSLASTLSRLPVEFRAQLAKALMTNASDADDHNLPLVVWYGLIPVADSRPFDLVELAAESKWPKTQRFIVRRLAESIDQQPESVLSLLDEVVETKDEKKQLNILRGIEDGLRGWRKAPKPTNWSSVAAVAEQTSDKEVVDAIRNLSVVFGDGRAIAELRKIVANKKLDAGSRRSALESMVSARADGLQEVCLDVLDDSRLNVVAAQGLALFDDPKIGPKLVANYKRFRAPQRPKVISLLTSRRSFASTLIDAIEKGKISSSELSAYDVRQIRSLGDDQLMERVNEIWGGVRDSPKEKVAEIAKMKSALNADVLAKANKPYGRALFNKTCSQCHRMYGIGEKIGPDLTGSNRNNIDYLLENILDPSAVVNKDFRMSIVETEGGQVLNGLVTSRTDKTTTLQTQTDLRTLANEDIASIRKTTFSPMPDGLLSNLSQDDIRDLFGYLMHPTQVADAEAK